VEFFLTVRIVHVFISHLVSVDLFIVVYRK